MYRSGHNGPDSKSGSPFGLVGSNPTVSATNKGGNLVKEKVGKVFSVARDNFLVDGFTVSKGVYGDKNRVTYFSLARGTDISSVISPYHKLLIVADGSEEVYGAGKFCQKLETGESVLTLTDTLVGMNITESAVCAGIEIRRNDVMNEAIKAGEVFKVAELVPYAEDKIVNMDVVHNDKMKFIVMAFDEWTGLSEHAAPGEALIFALDGEGVVGYEGQEYPIKSGENFHFAKAGLHSVRATKKFKMALLLMLE